MKKIIPPPFPSSWGAPHEEDSFSGRASRRLFPFWEGPTKKISFLGRSHEKDSLSGRVPRRRSPAWERPTNRYTCQDLLVLIYVMGYVFYKIHWDPLFAGLGRS